MVAPHTFEPDLMGDCEHCPLPEGHPTHGEAVTLPETPYAGTSGWSGSQTSRERAEDEDRGGVTTERQRVVLVLLNARGSLGATWRELAQVEGWHHGQASGALSTLHKTGHIARLATERRERCSVYVLPEFVGERETAEQGRAAADPTVIQYEEFRVVRPDDSVSCDFRDRARADEVLRHTGGRIQRSTVNRTPWEDVDD